MTDRVRVRPAAGGRASLVDVRAQPGARRRGAAGAWNGQLKLAVTAPPEGGRANKEIVKLAAELFGLSPSEVELVRGHSARKKTLRLERPPQEVRARIEALLDAT